MASAFRNSTVTTGTAPTLSPTKPAGVVANDLQLMWVQVDGSGQQFGGSGSTQATIGVPTGGATWFAVHDSINISNGDTATMMLWVQVAGGAEPASYTLTMSGGLAAGACVVAYSGVDVSGGALASLAAELATNPNAGSPPSSPVSIAANAITTGAANQRVVWFGGVDWNSASAAAFTDPATTTRRAVNTPAVLTNGLVVDFVQASQGTTGIITGTGTLAAAAGNFGAWMVALKDAAGGGGGAGQRNRLLMGVG